MASNEEPEAIVPIATMNVKNNLASWEQAVYRCPKCQSVTCVSAAGPMVTAQDQEALKNDVEFLLKVQNRVVVQAKCAGCGAYFSAQGQLVQEAKILPAGAMPKKPNGKMRLVTR